MGKGKGKKQRREAALREFSRAAKQIRARLDLAQTTPENERHWANADALSANAAANPADRKKVRERCRYECQNNPWAAGMVRTLVHHTIGTGPRLQVHGPDPAVNTRIEKAWSRWAKAIGLAGKLALAKMSKVRDGEVFLLSVHNELVPGPIKLDYRVIEADQATTFWADPIDPYQTDGIRFDRLWNPIEYHLLRHHPGGTAGLTPLAGDWYPAERIIHWFRAERPGQSRGLPEIMPAIPLFAVLRRFTMATLAAAEIAALFAAFLKTNGTANVSPMLVKEFESLEIERSMLTTLPEGWDVTQLKPEHPATTFEMFQRCILNEAARAISMPYNIAAGNSSGYNYSSGRLDHQTYFRKIEIDQSEAEAIVLDRIFAEWLDYALLVPGLLDGAPPLIDLEHEWFWDAPTSIDPMVEDGSAEIRLRSGRGNLQDEFAQQGLDWRSQIAKAAASFGLTVEDYQRRLANKIFGPDMAPQAPAAGNALATAEAETDTPAEFGGLTRQQWTRNRRAINDVLAELTEGTSTPAAAREFLQSIGLSERRAEALIDDALEGHGTRAGELEVTA